MTFKSKFLGRMRVSKSSAKPSHLMQEAHQDISVSSSSLYDEQVEVRADPNDIDECRDDLNPMEMFLSNASTAFAGVFGEAHQSMAEDSHSTSTSDVESVDDGAQEVDESDGAMKRFLSNVSSAFSGVVGEAKSMAGDIHSIATADVERVNRAKEEDDFVGAMETFLDNAPSAFSDDVVGENQSMADIYSISAADVESEDGGISFVQQEGVRRSHSSLAKEIKKLGKLEQIVEKAKNQILKHEKQIKKVEREQEKTWNIIKAHHAGVLSVAGKSDKESNNNKKLTGNRSVLAKQINKLGKLEQLMKKAKGQIIKYEKEIKMVEDKKEKTQEMISFLSNKLSIGTHIDDVNEKAAKDVDEVSSIGADRVSNVVGEVAAHLAYKAVAPSRANTKKDGESLKINAALNTKNRSLQADIVKKKSNISALTEQYQDQIVKIDEAREKEVFLLGRIQTLEEEVERLTSALECQREESERKHLADQSIMKEEFEKKFECFRQQLVSNMYEEGNYIFVKKGSNNGQLKLQ